MRQFSDIPHKELTLMDVHEECEKRIRDLDTTNIMSIAQYDVAIAKIVKNLIAEIEDIWK